MDKVIFVILICTIWSLQHVAMAKRSSPKKESYAGKQTRLITRLMERYGDYGQLVPPSQNGGAVRVQFGLSLQHITDVEDAGSGSVFMEVMTWRNYEWKDFRLMWNESQYGGVRSIRLHPSMFWYPDILLYNSVNADSSIQDTTCVVYSDGTVSWVPPAKERVQCSVEGLDVTCLFKFGSWTYDGTKLNLTLGGDEINLATFTNHGDYKVVSSSAERHVKLYDCCPESYIDVSFTLKLTRKPKED